MHNRQPIITFWVSVDDIIITKNYSSELDKLNKKLVEDLKIPWNLIIFAKNLT